VTDDDGLRHSGHDLVLGLLRDGYLAAVEGALRRDFPDAASDAEDAIAVAVVRLLVAFGDGRVSDEPRSWLFTAARNDIVRRLQRLHARQRPYEPDEDTRTVRAAEDEALADEVYKFVRSRIERWEQERMRVVTLLYVEAAHFGEPLTEDGAATLATEILGDVIPKTSIGNTWRRGFKRLASELRVLLGDDDPSAYRPHTRGEPS